MKLWTFFGLIFWAVICGTNGNFGENRQFSTVKINETLEANYPKLHLILINPQDKSQSASYTLQNLSTIYTNPWYNPMRHTLIYAFGFTESILSATTQAILDAYVKRGGNNLIVIDWSAYNGATPADYPVAIANMKAVGGLVGARVATTFRSFLTLRIHLVGHSLGAHLAAYINRAIPKSFLTQPVPKIIGLDPAGPYMYDPTYNNSPLNASDALIVQVIHTDMVAAGAPVKCGDIDFYPNGGGKAGVQPGCPPFDTTDQFALTNFCSHQMSVYYFAESVATKGSNVFAATRCNSYEDFVAGKCHTKNQLMGLNSIDFMTGDFYLQTNAVPPFDKGALGVTYTNSTR